jgi:hypothetical protein
MPVTTMRLDGSRSARTTTAAVSVFVWGGKGGRSGERASRAPLAVCGAQERAGPHGGGGATAGVHIPPSHCEQGSVPCSCGVVGLVDGRRRGRPAARAGNGRTGLPESLPTAEGPGKSAGARESGAPPRRRRSGACARLRRTLRSAHARAGAHGLPAIGEAAGGGRGKGAHAAAPQPLPSLQGDGPRIFPRHDKRKNKKEKTPRDTKKDQRTTARPGRRPARPRRQAAGLHGRLHGGLRGRGVCGAGRSRGGEN